jgi:ubiquinone/menaquinone biosynthesis C-methylase UbiE
MTSPTRPLTTEQIRQAWDTVAHGFDRSTTPRSMAFGERLLADVGLRPGLRFLDVASGSGALAVPAAREGADVVAVDISPAMIERLAARAQAEGLSGIQGLAMDGQALDLADDSFDASGSLNGVSLFPDLPAGLAEMVRVTRPGGTVLVAGFAAPQGAEFISWFVSATQSVVPGFAPLATDPPPLPFQIADRDRLRQLLGEAGLGDVSVRTVSWDMRFESGEELMEMVSRSNPIGAGWVAMLTDRQKTEVRHVLDGMFRERSGGGPGGVLHTGMNVGVGTP